MENTLGTDAWPGGGLTGISPPPIVPECGMVPGRNTAGSGHKDKKQMHIWNRETYIRAWTFAADAHGNQKVPGTDHPYIHHIGLVAMEAMAASVRENTNDPDLLVACALLHDTIEDTHVTYEDIKQGFGGEVADGVLALTKDPSLPSAEARMADSLSRIRQQPRPVWMVKLADRITNLQPPPGHWDGARIEAYRKEAALILSELGAASAYLSTRLARKIKQYPGDGA